MAGAEGYDLLHLHSGRKAPDELPAIMLQGAETARPNNERVRRNLLEAALIRLNRQRDAAPSGEPSDSRTSRECGPAVHRRLFQGEPEPRPAGASQ